MDSGLQKLTASAAAPEQHQQRAAGRRQPPFGDWLPAGRDFRPETSSDRVKQAADSRDYSPRNAISFKQATLDLIKLKQSVAELGFSTVTRITPPGAAGGADWVAAAAAAAGESHRLEPAPVSAQRRRRMSLMSTSASANVMGSHGIMKKRLSVPGDEQTFRSIEPIPRERRGAAAAASSERPASSAAASSSSSSARGRRSATALSEAERDVVLLPGYRARALSARAAVKRDIGGAAEWTKAFKIDYAPQSYDDNKRQRSHSEPAPGRAKPGGGGDGNSEALPGHPNARRRPWAEPPVAKATRGGHVEIHYESCLPKKQWLQVRPKKFVFNHKHGTTFENRSLQAARKIENVQEVTVWENPYHIVLFEKAAKSQ